MRLRRAMRASAMAGTQAKVTDRGRFEHSSRVMHHGRHCATCTQFYESHGVVHPIRNSPGYDPSIEKESREERHARARQAHYATARQERGSSVVERPPWAAGLSERHLLTIARAHGQNAGTPLWWERAGLWKGSGELRAELREGGHKGDTRGQVGKRAPRGKPVEQTRSEARRIARASATGGGDLPF
jgi:hypothetical protein